MCSHCNPGNVKYWPSDLLRALQKDVFRVFMLSFKTFIIGNANFSVNLLTFFPQSFNSADICKVREPFEANSIPVVLEGIHSGLALHYF